jgi:predicted MFS family arabinose efflux permease
MLPAGLMLALNPQTGGRRAKSIDWVGLCVLAFFMVTFISGLQALAHVRSTPQTAIVALVLATFALGELIWTETRHPQPLVNFDLFSNRNFAVASGLIFLLMFDIMTLLLYYNLFAQSRNGLGMSAVTAGFSLVPLSVALFGFARAAPWLGITIGLRRMLIAGSLLLALGCAIAWLSGRVEARLVVLMLGLFVAGAGIALPYATAPRVALAALSPTQAGKGSGMLNSCSFLGGTVGVTCGGIVFKLAGFSGVLVLLGLSALCGAVLCVRFRNI